MPAFCSCCDRRAGSDSCDCGPWFCLVCLLCVMHCRCAPPYYWGVDGNGRATDDDQGEPDVVVRAEK